MYIVLGIDCTDRHRLYVIMTGFKLTVPTSVIEISLRNEGSMSMMTTIHHYLDTHEMV